MRLSLEHVHTERFMRKNGIKGGWVGENSYKIMIYVWRHFASLFKVCICWAVYVASIKMFGPKSVEL